MKERVISYKLIRELLRFVYLWGCNPKLLGEENVPKDGAFIFAGNHVSKIDPGAPVHATNRVVHFLTKDKYYDNKLFSWFFKAMNCIRVSSSTKNPEALSEAINVLNNGGIVGIFPEGTRNKKQDGLLPFKYGVVKMASECDVPIVPFAIKGKCKFRSKDLVIRFGKPYKLKSNDLDKELDILYKKIEDLLEKE